MDSITTNVPSIHSLTPSSEYPGIALILGAGSILGHAVALSLLQRGCTKFILTDSSRPNLDSTASSLKAVVSASNIWSTILLLHGTTTDPKFRAHLSSEINSRFGRIDYTINIHSLSPERPISEFPQMMVDETMGWFNEDIAGVGIKGERSGMTSNVDVSGTWNSGSSDIGPPKRSEEDKKKEEFKIAAEGLNALWEVTRWEIGLMKTQKIRMGRDGVPSRQRGSIVNVIVGRDQPSSIDASIEDTISNFTKQDARENGQGLLRINAILTGRLERPFEQLVVPQDVQDQTGLGSHIPDRTERSGGRGIGGRAATVEEVMELVLFLSSGKSSFVHGMIFGAK